MRYALKLLPLALAGVAAVQTLGAQGTPIPVGPVSTGPSRGLELGTIDGIVADSALAPIQAAFVSILGTKIRVGTGPNGRFRITKVPVGQYLVIVKRVGFHLVEGISNTMINCNIYHTAVRKMHL